MTDQTQTSPNNITVRFSGVEISGAPEAILQFVKGWQKSEEKPQPWWVTETPWFERHGKLTPEEAADLEAGTYGTHDTAMRHSPKLSDEDFAAYSEAKRKLFVVSRASLERNLRR
ncbi:hypothetical protein [Brucella sp. 22210]|uniref:hypothetical protein n=1 Tax=Brucella sp. 22210 TaxID=3453892 RepID=UPI003F844D18